MNSLLIAVFIIIFSIIIFLLSFVLFKTSHQTINSDDLSMSEDDILTQVKTLIDKKNFKTAYNLAKKYLRQIPGHFDLRLIYAKSLYQDQQDYINAIKELHLVIKFNPKNIKAHLILGKCYFEINKDYKAIEHFKTVAIHDIANEEAAIYLAQLYFKTGQLRSALKMYSHFITLSNNKEELLQANLIILKIHSDFKEWDNVINKAKDVLIQYPDNLDVLLYLKEAYRNIGDKENVIAILKTCIEISPDNYELYDELSNTCYDVKDYDEAIKYASIALQFENIYYTNIQNTIAKSYIATDKITEGIDILQEALKKDPSNLYLKQTLALGYSLLNKFDKAVNLYSEILDEARINDLPFLKSNLSQIYCDWGKSLIASNNFNEAFDVFLKGLEVDDNNADIYFNMGNINYKIKNYYEAVKQYKRAIELAPQESSYYMAFGDLSYELENIYDAKQAYLDAISIDPDNALAHTSLGIIAAKEKDVSNALIHLNAASKLQPDNSDIKYNLALTYELSGNFDSAKEEYKKVLELNPNHKEAKINLQLLEDNNS